MENKTSSLQHNSDARTACHLLFAVSASHDATIRPFVLMKKNLIMADVGAFANKFQWRTCSLKLRTCVAGKNSASSLNAQVAAVTSNRRLAYIENFARLSLINFFTILERIIGKS